MRGFVALGPALRHLQGFAQGLVHIQGLAQLLVQGLVVAVGAGVCVTLRRVARQKTCFAKVQESRVRLGRTAALRLQGSRSLGPSLCDVVGIGFGWSRVPECFCCRCSAAFWHGRRLKSTFVILRVGVGGFLCDSVCGQRELNKGGKEGLDPRACIPTGRMGHREKGVLRGRACKDFPRWCHPLTYERRERTAVPTRLYFETFAHLVSLHTI